MSILVPVYNGAPYLRTCLQSIVAQQSSAFVVFICDDGSTDGSQAVIEEFANRYPFIQKVEKKHTERGLFHNLNGLLREVHSPFIRILCQDDVLLPHCVDEEIHFLETHPEITMAYNTPVIIDVASKRIQETEIWKWPNVLRPQLAVQQFYFHGCIPGNLSTVCFRKSAVEKYGAFNTDFTVSGDFDLWARFCEKEPLGVIGQRLVCIRRHAKQLSKATRSLLPFLVEDERIRTRLKKLLPNDASSEVKYYSLFYFGNARFKIVIDCLRRGRFPLLFQAIAYLGPIRCLMDAAVWAVSLGGRFFAPSAPFVLTETETKEHESSLLAHRI